MFGREVYCAVAASSSMAPRFLRVVSGGALAHHNTGGLKHRASPSAAEAAADLR